MHTHHRTKSSGAADTRYATRSVGVEPALADEASAWSRTAPADEVGVDPGSQRSRLEVQTGAKPPTVTQHAKKAAAVFVGKHPGPLATS